MSEEVYILATRVGGDFCVHLRWQAAKRHKVQEIEPDEVFDWSAEILLVKNRFRS